MPHEQQHKQQQHEQYAEPNVPEYLDDNSSHDSLDQYGSEHVTGRFDEDGSFIDQYGTTRSKHSESQHILHRSASVGSSAFSTLV